MEDTPRRKEHAPRITLYPETIEGMKRMAEKLGISQSQLYERACRVILDVGTLHDDIAALLHHKKSENIPEE